MKKNFKKGKLIWITGLSGSGKSLIAKKLKNKIESNNETFFLINGDDLRKIFKLKKYDKKSRLNYAYSYSFLCKKLTDQGINVVFSILALMDKPRLWNKKNIKKYVEIFIKSDVKKIISINKKKVYKKKKDIVGVSINPQFPKNPHIIIDNTFDKDLDILESELRLKIKKITLKKNYEF